MRRLGLAAVLLALVLWQLPQRWCRRHATGWLEGDADLRRALALSTAGQLAHTSQESFATGHRRFDNEWLFGSSMMAAMGFGQLALEHPGEAARYTREMDRAIERLTSSELRAFDREAWGVDPLSDLDGAAGHAAYYGYLDLVLGLRRMLGEHNPHADLHDAVSAGLERRFRRELLLETYPGERYPVDNAAAVGALALGARALGEPRPAVVARWVERARAGWIDPETGLLYQRMADDGSPVDAPRGSGTALAAYFLSFADRELARDLYRAAARELYGTVLGFGALREYPGGVAGRGDIDSGPLLFGFSISASGFALAGARLFGDEERFRHLYATVHLFGAPHGGRFVTGGALGNAILLAMLTATPRAAA